MGTVSNLANFFQQQQDQLVQGDQRIQTGLTKSKLSGQRLTTAPLLASGLNKSKNPVLQSLWEAVLDYNREWKHPSKMSDGERVRATAILDHIYKTCATYMTDKSFKEFKLSGAQARRKLRYDAFAALIVEVSKEIEQFGGKMLVGPTNFRENKRNYWLERLDPDHRAGYLISSHYNTWVTSGSTDSFWTWLQTPG